MVYDLKSARWLGAFSGQVRITLTATFIHFFHYHPPSELILDCTIYNTAKVTNTLGKALLLKHMTHDVRFHLLVSVN